MISTLVGILAAIVIATIQATGLAGVFILMLLESCGIPAPSEVIMPFAGFLVAAGQFNFWLVVLAGTFGNLVGSLLAYYIGLRGGRPLIERYGKYILINHHDLDKADVWFAKYGELTVLIGRLLPVVRTYISFPAGISKMNLKKFSFYTTLGAFPWCVLFTWLGVKLQHNWELIHTKLRALDGIMIVFVAALVIYYVYNHLKKNKTKLPQ